jgi:tetratricopeptide (TPR) repeat protein
MTGISILRFCFSACVGLALAALIALSGTMTVRAAGSEPTTQAPECPKGWFYNERCKACAHNCSSGKTWSCSQRKCVKQSGLKLNDEERYAEAESLIRAGYYVGALEMLWAIEKRDDPKVLTYIGYATRKLGNVDRGIGYYHKALALNPDFVRAREYLGEGYLQKGEVGKAREQLAEIATRCGKGCREYVMLTNAIVEHETGEKRDTATW